MVLIPPVAPGGAAASVGMAGRATGAARFPGAGTRHTDWNEEEEMAGYGAGRSHARAENGFSYQGKAYDPILHEPMAVSAETHADFWEDDMDYTENVSYEGLQTRTEAQSTAKEEICKAHSRDNTCKKCPPEGSVGLMVRRCSRWSQVTISYQTRVCGTFYNPQTQQIQEFKYLGVAFDGWKPHLCQFWEAKARYDQFFRANGHLKEWWTGDISAIAQAARHQAVATPNSPLKVVWKFMQPVSAEYFKRMFKYMPDIIVRWEP